MPRYYLHAVYDVIYHMRMAETEELRLYQYVFKNNRVLTFLRSQIPVNPLLVIVHNIYFWKLNVGKQLKFVIWCIENEMPNKITPCMLSTILFTVLVLKSWLLFKKLDICRQFSMLPITFTVCVANLNDFLIVFLIKKVHCILIVNLTSRFKNN